jgi:hypothetical protein
MMLGRRVGAVVAFATIALLVLPAAASAKRGYFFLPRETEVLFGAKTSNGYRIQVIGTRVGDRSRAKVIVRRADTVAIYRVPARVRRDMLRVNLGAMGRIDLRFHLRKREVEDSQPGCHGRPPMAEIGSFKGFLRFRGEGGYTRISTTRIRGEVWSAFREACKLSTGLRARSMQRGLPHNLRPSPRGVGRSKGRESSQLTELGAAWTGRSRSIAVSYASLELPLARGRELSLSFATAEVRERRGRMDIERSAFVIPDDGVLLITPPAVGAQGATLTLQPPFAGSASYESRPGVPPTWSGSLRVRLPGAAVVPLTGKRFVSALCQGSAAKEMERCMRPVIAEQKRFGG